MRALAIESAQRSESMSHRLKALTNPRLPLASAIDGALQAEESMLESAVRLESLHNAGSCLVAPLRAHDLPSKLSACGLAR